MVQDLVEHYVNQTKDEVGKKVAIELKDIVSNILIPQIRNSEVAVRTAATKPPLFGDKL
jgi:hypothetical protein